MQLNSPTITKALHQLQILPPASQQTALDFINFLVIQNKETSQKASQNLTQITAQTQEKPKRQFGQMVGKGSFKINDDFEMTEEEFINL